MAKTVDYLPIAAAGGANVMTQAAFVGSGFQSTGAVNGIADPTQANKAWRQSSMMAAALANYISTQLNIDVLDDGNIANLITNLSAALRNANARILTIPYALNVIFDASQASKFEITLTGNAAFTLPNAVPGQEITIVVHQDGVGGHTFTPPSGFPMDQVSPSAGLTSLQKFIVLSNGTIFPTSGMIAQ